MWEATFYQHYNFAKYTFNANNDEDYAKVKAELIKLLKMKYSLEIIGEYPLDFKKIKYYILFYLGHTKIEETLNTYSHVFNSALDSVVSVIDILEDD